MTGDNTELLALLIDTLDRLRNFLAIFPRSVVERSDETLKGIAREQCNSFLTTSFQQFHQI